MPLTAMLFCCDYFDSSKPDEDYKQEYDCAKALRMDVYLFNLDDFMETHRLSLKSTKTPITIIYRGWMLTYEDYSSLYNALLELGYHMINTPEQYRACHHLPSWYNLLENITPKSVWSNGIPSNNEITHMLESFKEQPIIIKDYFKSRKHEWFDACFIPNASDDHAYTIINNFINRQGSYLIGGIVLREYIELSMIGNHDKSNMPIAKEVRVFCFNHQTFAYIYYWTGDVLADYSEFESLINKGANLNSNFYTIDLAQTITGEWIILEVGDGQVSGLQDYSAELFYKGLAELLDSDCNS